MEKKPHNTINALQNNSHLPVFFALTLISDIHMWWKFLVHPHLFIDAQDD